MSEINAAPMASASQVLEFMTWVASAFDQFNNDHYFGCLHGKRVAAGVIPLVLESLLAKDMHARLTVVQMLQRLLYDQVSCRFLFQMLFFFFSLLTRTTQTNTQSVADKGGVSVILGVLRELSTYFQHTVSSSTVLKSSSSSIAKKATASSTSPPHKSSKG